MQNNKSKLVRGAGLNLEACSILRQLETARRAVSPSYNLAASDNNQFIKLLDGFKITLEGFEKDLKNCDNNEYNGIITRYGYLTTLATGEDNPLIKVCEQYGIISVISGVRRDNSPYIIDTYWDGRSGTFIRASGAIITLHQKILENHSNLKGGVDINNIENSETRQQALDVINKSQAMVDKAAQINKSSEAAALMIAKAVNNAVAQLKSNCEDYNGFSFKELVDLNLKSNGKAFISKNGTIKLADLEVASKAK